MDEWLRCRPWIEAALELTGGTHTIDDILAGVGSGIFQFWPGKTCAAVTEIIAYPRLKAINFFLLGGDLQELLEMEKPITEWAKQVAGCSKAMGVGRKGFEKVLKKHGYEPKWVCCAKDI